MEMLPEQQKQLMVQQYAFSEQLKHIMTAIQPDTPPTGTNRDPGSCMNTADNVTDTNAMSHIDNQNRRHANTTQTFLTITLM